MSVILAVPAEALNLFLESAPYVLFGLLVGGLLRAFLSPGLVAAKLGRGTVGPVLRAAVWGVPLPLCSCGVLPAAASLQRQGASRGAVTSFLIATPETGVDSVAVSFALLDPIMAIARPVSAFCTAIAAGLAQNLFGPARSDVSAPDLRCPVDGCCDGVDCPPEVHRRHHSLGEKLRAGVRFAVDDLWGDLAVWFFVGLLAAGVITALVPESFMAHWLGGGVGSMLAMLAVGIPLYICATASTPIAAALVLKGVSPGAALVFLLAGPATNITSLTVLLKLLGKRGTAVYLGAIAVCSVTAGLILDGLYRLSGISASAVIGEAAEVMPAWAEWACALALTAMSVKPMARVWLRLSGRSQASCCSGTGCGCDSASGASCADTSPGLTPLTPHPEQAPKGENPSGGCGCGGCGG